MHEDQRKPAYKILPSSRRWEWWSWLQRGEIWRWRTEKATSENLDKNLEKKYSELLKAIQFEKFSELEKNKNEIFDALTEEIVKRYYYTEGVYQQKAAFDPTILKATTILNNQTAYNNLLKN